MLECVVNISQGRDLATLHKLAHVCGSDLLDVHSDPFHHRSVFTLIGTESVRILSAAACQLLDINQHSGVHPRLGIVDVVPFVPLEGSTLAEAVNARDDFALWAASNLDMPCFLYGPPSRSLSSERSLPDIRQQAWVTLFPDLGPRQSHETAGAICVGARQHLIAFNVWLSLGTTLLTAQKIARDIRSQHIRSLGLQVGHSVQVSMNLLDWRQAGPEFAFDRVHEVCTKNAVNIERSEVVGLIPHSATEEIPQQRWKELDISIDKTVEFRQKFGFVFRP